MNQAGMGRRDEQERGDGSRNTRPATIIGFRPTLSLRRPRGAENANVPYVDTPPPLLR